MSDTRLDIERDKYLEWKDQQREAMRSTCESCENHNAECPYFVLEDERKTKAIGNLRNVLEIQEVGNERL